MSAGIAGTLAAVNYLAEIGQPYGQECEDRFLGFSGRRLYLKTGMTVLRGYDHVLSAAILDELETLHGVRIHGLTDQARLDERVPSGVGVSKIHQITFDSVVFLTMARGGAT